jgi:hypothetical protein
MPDGFSWIIVIRFVLFALALASTWSNVAHIRVADVGEWDAGWRFVFNGLLWAWFVGFMGGFN